MNPNMVAKNRTARIAAEAVSQAAKPVYSTVTPAREHIMAVEIENDYGFRFWCKVTESKVKDFIDAQPDSYSLSDVDHHARCWCQ